MKTVTTVLFDLGNVLTLPQDQLQVERMRALVGAAVPLGDFRTAYEACRRDYDGGLIDYREYWRRVAARLEVELPDSLLPTLRDTDLRSWFNINPEMLRYVGRLHDAARHLVLISNIHQDGAEYLERSYAWKDLFAKRIYSCEHRVNKPDARIFRIALAAVDAAPEESLLVDDLPENVLGGRQVGLNAIRFTDVGDLRRKMSRSYRVVG
ncbi:MAG TPA: HAD family phosphatase [Rectinemataceae bacterium]|nr:HAD family phosphatase [Rectinemataceae bacterium]